MLIRVDGSVKTRAAHELTLGKITARKRRTMRFLQNKRPVSHRRSVIVGSLLESGDTRWIHPHTRFFVL